MTIKDIKKSLVVFLAIFGLFSGAKASAVTYTSEATVQFNFNSEISVVIDSADIEILDLAPGTSSDSNVVGITISTNNVVGYTASATVGNATYNTTSMIHTNGTDAFTSIAEDASEASLSTDNTWGYTTSLDNGSSWANLSGLPIYTDTAKEIAATNSPASDAIKFKINAKASTSQAAGDYKNVINFTVVANVPPRDFPDVIPSDNPKDPVTNRPTIQSISEDVCNQVEAYDTQFLVTDIRDHKNYWISKLRDGHCWMTQNLDFDIDSTKTYTSATTDLGWNGMGYTSTSWQPSLSTIPSTDIDSGTGYIRGWQSSSSDPYSVDVGDLYWDPDTNTFSETPDPASGAHMHSGNYYNLIAATANNTALSSQWDPQPNSICPTNWGLPPMLGQARALNDLSQYYGNTTATGEYYIAAPLYFIVGEQIYASYDSSTSQIVGRRSTTGSGFYWYNTRGALQLYPSAVSFTSPDAYIGNNIRCRTREKDKFTVNFNANNGSGSMSAQKISYGKSAALTTNTFTRSGYSFNGWNTKADGTGVGYGNRDSYSAPAINTTSSVTLYAQWVEDSGQGGGGGGYSGKTLQDAYEQAYVRNEDQSGHYYDTNAGRYKKGLYVPHKTNGVYDGTYFEATVESDYEGIPAKDLRFAMQDISMTIDGVKVCDYATVIGSGAYVLDLRDFKSYHVTKLADGKCWMTQNLDLNLDSTRTYTHADTDLGWTNGDASATWQPERSTVTYDGSSTTSVPNWELDYYNPYSEDPGPQFVITSGSNNDDAVYYTIEDCMAHSYTATPDECMHYHTGNYYNWSAAVASNDTNADYYKTNYNVAPNSVCPAGWRLPRAHTAETRTEEVAGEWNKLLVAQGVINAWASVGMTISFVAADGLAAIRNEPIYLVRSGEILRANNVHTLTRVGARVANWTGTTRGYDNAYALFVNIDGKLYPSMSVSRRDGRLVRCVAR